MRSRNAINSGFDTSGASPASAANPNAAGSAIKAPAVNLAPAAPPSEAGPRSGGTFNPAADHKAPPLTAAMLQTSPGYQIAMALERLKALARSNADVAWLLAQYQGFSKALKP